MELAQVYRFKTTSGKATFSLCPFTGADSATIAVEDTGDRIEIIGVTQEEIRTAIEGYLIMLKHTSTSDHTVSWLEGLSTRIQDILKYRNSL
jgi:UPF0288 family protein (methanogenesis marker protein 3)